MNLLASMELGSLIESCAEDASSCNDLVGTIFEQGFGGFRLSHTCALGFFKDCSKIKKEMVFMNLLEWPNI
ncbi:hypothetical protein ACFX2H_010028 [Malus domestica]